MAVSDHVTYDYAQPINDDYFNTKKYPHNCVNKIKVEMYSYSAYDVSFSKDISSQVISYSYDCDYSNNIRQTACITIKVDTHDETWFMRRENKMRHWTDKWNQVQSIRWIHSLYKLTKIYINPDTGIEQKLELGFFIPTDNDYSFDSTTGTVTINLSGLSAILTKEYGGSVSTIRIGKMTIDPDTHQTIEKSFPSTLSIAQGLSIDADLFYNIAMGSNAQIESMLNITAPCPIEGCYVGNGQKVSNIPETIEFDADVSRMDMIEKVVEETFEGGAVWIDENRFLHISSKPIVRNDNDIVLYWRDYKDIVISENVSYNDSDFYNITEVYGKDNLYYGICDESYLDGGITVYGRKRVLTFNELQSNEECAERAKWENYKVRHGRQTIKITLVDRYIYQLQNPSNQVGKLIEYTTVDGDTNMYFINKISNNNEVWDMELQLFKPLYNTDDIKDKYTLETPYIEKHELINNNTLRLYIKGNDIGLGVVKIYGGTASNVYDFINESVNTNGTASLSWKDENAYKIIDIPINNNGKYYFRAALYSPLYEDSGLGGSQNESFYTAEVTEIVIPAIDKDPDPYPHPNMFEPTGEHEPYLITNTNALITTDNDDNIII